jgi:hypothetical protein
LLGDVGIFGAEDGLEEDDRGPERKDFDDAIWCRRKKKM